VPGVRSAGCVRYGLPPATMTVRQGRVVVVDPLEVLAAEDQQAVEALAANRPDPAFGVTAQVRMDLWSAAS
jgi:hypothetical protein